MRSIRRLLVANRGEIASRVLVAAREQGIRTVAVFVDADADAPFVAQADMAVRLATSYLDGAAILEAATLSDADAIHPGYGFLSENAAFAADVISAGLTWVGPPADVIAAMGDKISAKRIAVDSGVPTLASSEDPDDASAVGYPLLVKAAAGGGGKGMAVVADPDDLPDAVAGARRVARAAFGDDRVFLERYLPRARHVEIQILADEHGNYLHLGERECSIQRRHQKILEESPSPVLDERLRNEMGEAAVRLARAIEYRNAGTVEFLLDDDTRDFYFLEVNTRLQVEHPVTEAVTGLDLVALQLDIACGGRLALPTPVRLAGHAIEVRLYAEDPDSGFLPAAGVVAAFVPPDAPAVRWDTGVDRGSVIGTNFDPMLAKVIAFDAGSRRSAAAKLALALERLHIGGVVTNRDFLVAILRSPEFLAGDTTTDFIDRVELEPATPAVADAAVVAALWLEGKRRAEATVLTTVPSGWRNSPMPDQEVLLFIGGEDVSVRYHCDRDRAFHLADGRIAAVHSWSPDRIELTVDRRRWSSRVTYSEPRLFVQTETGTVGLEVVPRFVPPTAAPLAGAVSAPMPGSVLEVRGSVGDKVVAGQVLVILEAMKMEHHVRAPADGRIADIRVEAGKQIELGTLLLVLENEPSTAPDGAS